MDSSKGAEFSLSSTVGTVFFESLVAVSLFSLLASLEMGRRAREEAVGILGGLMNVQSEQIIQYCCIRIQSKNAPPLTEGLISPLTHLGFNKSNVIGALDLEDQAFLFIPQQAFWDR